MIKRSNNIYYANMSADSFQIVYLFSGFSRKLPFVFNSRTEHVKVEIYYVSANLYLYGMCLYNAEVGEI